MIVSHGVEHSTIYIGCDDGIIAVDITDDIAASGDGSRLAVSPGNGRDRSPASSTWQHLNDRGQDDG
jgi:hypothetical protein